MADEPHPGPQPGFLPPEPAGPEPDLGADTPPLQHTGGDPYPQGHQQPGWGQPPQGWQQPSQGWQQQPQGWQQPPQGWQQQPQPWAYQPQPAVPDNGSAVAGFVLSVVAGTLLVISIGFSSIVSIVCAALGIVYSRRGRARVDRGETPKHRGLAQAGFVTGIVALVLSVMATAVWIAFFVEYGTNEQFRDEFNNELDDAQGIESTVRLALVAARLVAQALA